MRVFYLLLCVSMVACNNNRIRGDKLMPAMAQVDSLELIFFKTPDSPRYFTYLPTTDKELIKALVSDVSGEIQPENPCMKEGKIYCFKKGGIFNTIFFAYKDPGCKVLRFIVNGKLYYFPMGETVQKKLAEYQTMAREPVSATSFLRSNNK